MKTCSKCGINKPISEFYQKNNSQLSSKCKSCFAEYYNANKERIKQYRCANKSKKRSYNKKYHAENKDKIKARISAKEDEIREYQKAYREVNRERLRILKKTYREANRELVRLQSSVNQRNRKAKSLGVPGEHTVDDIKELLNIQANMCACCKSFIDTNKPYTYHVDHIVPISKGGCNSISNLQILCPTCNSEKATKIRDYRTKAQKINIANYQQQVLFKTCC